MNTMNYISRLDVDIRPGSGLGIFELGTSLWKIIDQIRELQLAFSQVDLKFDPDSPSTTPIVLHIRPHLDLLFSGHQQRLHTICIRKLRDPNPPVTLRYKNDVLTSSNEVLRRRKVNRLIGPSGDDLRFRGVRFSFEDDGIREGFSGSIGHSDDRMREVKQVIVSQKSPVENGGDALDEVLECSIMAGDVARAVIKVHDGVTLYFYPSSTPPIHVRIGETTAQDLTIDLGTPPRVHYKDDDRMAIHSTSPTNDELETGSEYFFNYFQHGIDFLISGTTHAVKKIILHSNIPGSPLFQRYNRCPWEIEGTSEAEHEGSPCIHFYERSETISRFLSPNEEPPAMPLDRTEEDDDLTLPSAITRLLGFDGIILEVTNASHVVSVTLF